MTSARWVLVSLFLAAFLLPLRAQEQTELVINALSSDGLVEYDEQTGVVSDPAGVIARYGDVELIARRLKFDRQAMSVEAEGNVCLQRGKEIWTSDRIQYNFVSREINAAGFRTGVFPFFAAGEGLQSNLTNQTHSATNAFLTTDDVTEPGHRIRAKRIVFVPGKHVDVERAVFYSGKLPLLYLPSYRRHLEQHPSFFALTPGYRSLYGPYLLSRYHWAVSTNADFDFRLDYRVERGVAGGVDSHYNIGNWGEGVLRTYFLHDHDPGVDPLNSRPIDPDRGRIAFSHSAFPRTNLSVKALLDRQSDAYVAHDFFEAQYRKDAQPKSFFEVDRLWPNFSLNFLAQLRVNDFFQTVERLPDVKLTAFRQQLGVSPFYYESESSGAFLRFRTGDYFAATNYSAFRADTLHQLLVPQTLFGWLNITPRLGSRFTYYGAEDDTGLATDEQRRWVFNTGAELSFKAARVWSNARSGLLDVTQLRHIIEPSVNYSYVPEPNRRPQDLPQFDYEWYCYELRPLDSPDYNSIDGIDSQNVIRFGLHNKLQTKRGGQSDDLADWALYLDWRLSPQDRQTTFADLYSDLDFKPRSWLTLNSQARYGINQERIHLATHTATIEPNDLWSWKIGHRYVRDIEALEPDSGHSLLLSSFLVRLDQNWALRLRHHFDARNHVLQEQHYTLYRDFRSWTGALTFRLRDNKAGDSDFTVAFMLSLKAFPRFGLGQESSDPDALFGN